MAAETKSSNNALVDYARFLGAIAIIYFHLKLPNGHLALFALSMFSTFSFYFLARQLPKLSMGSIVISRASRVLIPWVFWFAIFAIAKILDALVSERPMGGEFELWMILTGPSIHLWYLPYLFFSSIAAALLWKNFVQLGSNQLLIILLYVCLCVGSAFVSKLNVLSTPFAQWLYVLPASAFGFLVAMKPLQPKQTFSLVAISATVFCLQSLTALSVGSVQLLISSLVVVLSLSVSLERTWLSEALARASMGVYLVHPLVAAVLLRSIPSNHSIWITFAMTCLISTVFATAANRSKLTKMIV
jgi:hypothetical protein